MPSVWVVFVCHQCRLCVYAISVGDVVGHECEW